jgi:hypothetical protein
MAAMTGFKGVFSIDAMVAMLPILLIVFIGFNAILLRADAAEIAYQKGQLLGLLDASENMMKTNAVCENGACHAGWINGTSLSPAYAEYQTTESQGPCIYRIAAYGDTKEIAKAFVCRR